MTRRVKMPTAPQWRNPNLVGAPEVPSSPEAPSGIDIPTWAWVTGLVVAVAAVTAGIVLWLVGGPADLSERPLAVGNCAIGVPFDGSDVAAAELVDCGELHDVEVYAVTTVRGEGNWPGELAADEAAARACRAAAAADLMGLDAGWQLLFLRPTADGWAAGDRAVTCLISRSSGTQTAGSVVR